MNELEAGVDVEVRDEVGIVRDAELRAADTALKEYDQISPALAGGEVVVLTRSDAAFNRELSYDLILAYRAGPFCGLAPDVGVAGTADEVVITIRPNSHGDCDAMEYDEMIGITLVPPHAPRDVKASVVFS